MLYNLFTQSTKLVYLQTITIKALIYTHVLKWKHIIAVFITPPQVDPGLTPLSTSRFCHETSQIHLDHMSSQVTSVMIMGPRLNLIT